MIKICHITTVHPYNDERIFNKECLSLLNAGYEVSLIAKYKEDCTLEGIKISALPVKKNRFYRFFLQIEALIKAFKLKAQVYHFHDPELMFAGVVLKIFGKRVIYDVHEDIVKQVLYKAWIRPALLRRILSGLIYFVEQFCTLFFDRIVVVTADISKKFSPHKTVMVCNYPVLSQIDQAELDTKKTHENITRLIYAGGLTEIRGIREIISSLSHIRYETELILLGEWESDTYKGECMKLPGWEKVKYIGKVIPEAVYPYIKSSDIGLSMLYPAKNYLTSLPVKAFEYMACSKPFIMSDFDYWEEVFTGAALFCDPKDIEGIARCAEQLIADKNMAAGMGRKGRQLIEEKYTWEKERVHLINMYHDILK
ncbi:MAG: Glycosyl transferases group 1 [Bacteroidetes bacterium ADurb.Bin408]|nr:MAG: Glycosyl transferases group 1 [Bacteroidetes bacterium ADurb.Bin408]